MKVVIFIEKGDLQTNWNDYSENEKWNIGLILNKQGLSNLGYVPKISENI